MMAEKELKAQTLSIAQLPTACYAMRVSYRGTVKPLVAQAGTSIVHVNDVQRIIDMFDCQAPLPLFSLEGKRASDGEGYF